MILAVYEYWIKNTSKLKRTLILTVNSDKCEIGSQSRSSNTNIGPGVGASTESICGIIQRNQKQNNTSTSS